MGLSRLRRDVWCDSPWNLINSSVYAMKRIKPDPDFILWTGDDTLHTNDEEKYVPAHTVVEIVGNITILIKDVFPNTKVYPVLGNHDMYPKNQMAPGENEILSQIAQLWEDWLTPESFTSFQKDGFYKETFGSKNQHLLIALNSNFWYKSNKKVDGTGDPGDEFAWMEDSLNSAKQNSQKVFLVGHIPSGYFEHAAIEPWYWLYPEYNERFNDIIRSYADVISGQFFGHHHTDHFKIFKDASGKVISSVLLTPGITPWMTTLPGVDDGANNPGIRLIEYDRDSLHLKDYQQYYLDLAKANNDSQSEAADMWELEYTATEAFNIPDISTVSWGNLALNMRSGCESIKTSCPEVFNKYFLYNSVSYNLKKCDETCQKYQLCAMTEVDFDAYKSCQDNWGSSATSANLTDMFLILLGLAVLLIV
ncbi:acid sphingomyelinase-like phosphodiesterase 3b isoform X2 [Styela clava]